LLSLLAENIRNPLKKAYATMMRANMSLKKLSELPWGGDGSAWSHAFSEARRSIGTAKLEIENAREGLLSDLGHDQE